MSRFANVATGAHAAGLSQENSPSLAFLPTLPNGQHGPSVPPMSSRPSWKSSAAAEASTEGFAWELPKSSWSAGAVGLASGLLLGLSRTNLVARRGARFSSTRHEHRLARRVSTLDAPSTPKQKKIDDAGDYCGDEACTAEVVGFGGGASFGGYTASNSENRLVVPTDRQREGRQLMKIVYVVLESQYQASMTAAVKQINKSDSPVCAECTGYLLEEIRNPDTLEDLKLILRMQMCLFAH